MVNAAQPPLLCRCSISIGEGWELLHDNLQFFNNLAQTGHGIRNPAASRCHDRMRGWQQYGNGLGMSPEQTQACFEAFSRFGDTTRVPEGMGIGLFSVKRLAQQMDLPLRIMSRLHHGTAIGVGLIPVPDKYSMGSD